MNSKLYARILGAWMLTLLCAMTLLLVAPIEAQTRCPGGSVSVTTSNAGTIFNQHPAGTVYCFSSGTYNNFAITPEDGDQFYSSSLHGAVLNGGGTTVTAFQGMPSGDVSTDANFGPNITGVRVDGFKFIRYINPQIWAYSRAGNTGTIVAFSSWTIKDNLFEGTSTQPQTFAITIALANWGCAENVTITGNTITGLTHGAILGNMIDGDITNNIITNNGWGARSRVVEGQDSLDNYNIEWNGVIKVTNNTMWTNGAACTTGGGRVPYIANNQIDRNRWTGVWADVRVINFLVENNQIRGNSGAGIMHEISETAIYRYNTLHCNVWEWNNSGWPSGEVTIWDARNVNVEGNLIRTCGSGDTYSAASATWTYNSRGGGGAKSIVVLDANRGGSTGTRVHDNDIVISAGANLAVMFERYNSNAMTSTFTSNTYCVNTLGRSIYRGFGSDGTSSFGTTNFSGWQAKSKDTAGSETTTQTLCSSQFFPTITPGGPTATATTTPTLTPTQPSSGCYNGVCAQIPGRIQAENFDYGAEGVAYNDVSPGNQFNSTYRPQSGDADIKAVGSEWAIGFGEAGDWYQYTVSVASSGYYTVNLRAAENNNPPGGRTVNMSIDGANITTTPITVPTVAAWDEFGIVTLSNIYVQSGTRTLRITLNQTYIDVDYIEFVQTSGVTSTPTNTTAPTATHTPSATPTASNTPVPPTAVPSNTPTATREVAPDIAAAIQTQDAAQHARATAAAAVSGQQAAIATQNAALTNLQATQRAAQSTMEAADRQVDLLIATPGP
jgi:hypothetical protein